MKTCTEFVLIFEDEGSVMSPTPGTPAPHVVVAVLAQGPLPIAIAIAIATAIAIAIAIAIAHWGGFTPPQIFQGRQKAPLQTVCSCLSN